MPKESKKTKERVSEERRASLQHFTCLNQKQEDFKDLVHTKDITICTGVPGSGKTYCALGIAFGMLGQQYKRIVIVKSVQTIKDEAVGFLPGSIEDKLSPFLVSFTGNIDKLFNKKDAGKEFIKKGIVDILPIAYVRGVTQDDCIVIVDEAQNITNHGFKTLVTRIGSNCKYIFLGDTEQVDMKKKEESCLSQVVEIFKDSPIIGSINFVDEDCVRNPIIPLVLSRLREHNI